MRCVYSIILHIPESYRCCAEGLARINRHRIELGIFERPDMSEAITTQLQMHHARHCAQCHLAGNRWAHRTSQGRVMELILAICSTECRRRTRHGHEIEIVFDDILIHFHLLFDAGSLFDFDSGERGSLHDFTTASPDPHTSTAGCQGPVSLTQTLWWKMQAIFVHSNLTILGFLLAWCWGSATLVGISEIMNVR